MKCRISDVEMGQARDAIVAILEMRNRPNIAFVLVVADGGDPVGPDWAEKTMICGSDQEGALEILSAAHRDDSDARAGTPR